jgi:hypothetical protein
MPGSVIGRLRAPADSAWWTLQRFGMTPAKLARRLVNRSEPAVLCISIPKAGTHLLERAVCLHPRLYRKLLGTQRNATLGDLRAFVDRLGPGQVAVAHLRFHPEYPPIIADGGVRSLVLVRDPRDIVISLAFYSPEHARQRRIRELLQGIEDPAGRIRIMIEGRPSHGIPSIGERLAHYAGWLDSGALVVRFEDLVGAKGGGDAARQAPAVSAIYRHLGIDDDRALVERVVGRLFSSASPTFRRGAVGSWRRHFGPELEESFRLHAGPHLGLYGYETGAA